jgi:hypothetical protein
MEEKYKLAIKAGAIGAIVLILISLCMTISANLIGGKAFQEEIQRWGEQYSNPQNVPTGPQQIPESLMGKFLLIGIVQLILISLLLATYVGAGALSAKYSAAQIKSTGDAALVGAVAGVVAEVIHRIVTSFINFIVGLVLPLGSASSISEGLSAFISEYVCCLPAMLIVGVILAIIGAVGYVMIRPKEP